MPLQHIDATIRKLTAEHVGSRPFLCEGSPLNCVMAQVGINPGTDTPFWPYWSVNAGCDKKAWLGDFYKRKAGKRTPTRDRIEILNEAVRPFKVLELNLYHRYSASEADLPEEHRNTDLFEFMLDTVRPRLLIVHGKSPRAHLERLLGTSLRIDEFTATTFRGAAIEVFVAKRHLAYVAGGDTYVREVGRQLRRRAYELTGTAASSADQQSSAVPTRPVKLNDNGAYTWGALQAQYAERKVPLSATAVAEVAAGGKFCSRCHRRLPPEAFAPSPQSATGLRSACRECIRKRK